MMSPPAYTSEKSELAPPPAYSDDADELAPPSFDALEDRLELEFPEMFLPRFRRTRNAGIVEYRGRTHFLFVLEALHERAELWSVRQPRVWQKSTPGISVADAQTMLRVLRAQLGRVLNLWRALIARIAQGEYDDAMDGGWYRARQCDLALLDELDTLHELDRLAGAHMPDWRRICADCACEGCVPNARRCAVVREFAREIARGVEPALFDRIFGNLQL